MTDKTLPLTSPVGDILFSSLRTARKNAFTGNLEYPMRLEIDGDAKGATEFKTALKKINKDLVITEDKEGNSAVKKEGNYIVNARSKDRPKVYDKSNSRVAAEDVPMLEGGTARIMVTPFTSKSGKGGGINLVGVQLIDITEYQGAEPVDEEDLLKALKAANKS